jgi:hypothetical protein
MFAPVAVFADVSLRKGHARSDYCEGLAPDPMKIPADVQLLLTAGHKSGKRITKRMFLKLK